MARQALCIGSNAYPGTDRDLRGCVDDAADRAATRSARDFAVRKMVDAQATKAAMTSAIRGLVAGAASDPQTPRRFGSKAARRSRLLV